MTVPTVSCTNCGKNFTTDDLRGTSCRYCGTLLAHHARAAQQVAVVNQMLADRNGNGIPDAFEGIAANAQANAMNQAFGGPPAGGFGGHPGAGLPPVPMQHAQYHATQAANQATKIALVGVLVVVIPALLIAGIAAFIVAMTFFGS